MLCSQAPKVHLLPMIATKGGRRQMGKVLACPIYKRMNIETAYDLSALAQEGGESRDGALHSGPSRSRRAARCLNLTCDCCPLVLTGNPCDIKSTRTHYFALFHIQ